MNIIHERFVQLDKKVYMTLTESLELSQELGRRFASLNPAPDLAVGIANGALLTTKVASEEASLPYQIVRVRRTGSRIKQKMAMTKRLVRLPASLLAWHPIGFVSRAFDRLFGKIEQSNEKLFIDVAGKTVLIVDDCIDTGSSIRHVREQIRAAGAKHIHTAVLCWTKSVDSESRNGVVPSLYLHRRIHYYPWSNNSPHYKDFLSWLKEAQLSLWT